MKLTTLLIAALALAPTVALADEAADHVAKGTRFYNIQDWAHALDEYKQAYALDPHPETLWAIAQTQRLSGDCRSAILTYKAFMRTASSTGANAALDWIKTCEADLEAQRRIVESATTPPAPEPSRTTPPPTQPNTTPPPPTASPVAVPPPPPPRPAGPPGLFSDPLGDALLVVGVGGVVAGGVLLGIGSSNLGNADGKPTSGARDSAVSLGAERPDHRRDRRGGRCRVRGGRDLAYQERPRSCRACEHGMDHRAARRWGARGVCGSVLD